MAALDLDSIAEPEEFSISWATIVTSPSWREYAKWLREMRRQYLDAAVKHRKNPQVRDDCLERAAWYGEMLSRPEEAIAEMESVVRNYIESGDEETMKEVVEDGGLNGIQRAYQRITGAFRRQ